MSNNIKNIAYLLIIVLSVGAVGYFINDWWALLRGVNVSAADEAKNQRPPTPVKVAKAHRSQIRITTESVGTLKAREQVRLTSQVSGLVQAILFTEGERVEQGQVLVELDNDQEQAELAEVIAIRAEAHRQYQRGLELQDSGLITPAQLDELEAAFKTAKAGVQVTEAELRDLTIKALKGLSGYGRSVRVRC